MKNDLDVMLNKLQILEKEVVALKAEKQKLQHELKNTNTSLAFVKTKKNEKKTTITFVKTAANKNSVNSNEKLVKVLVQKQTEKKKNATVKKNHLLPPSVQKAPRQVLNSHHAKSHQKVPPSPHGKPRHMKRRFQQMDTCQELGSFVVQRFGAVVLRFRALVLWSGCAHVLVWLAKVDQLEDAEVHTLLRGTTLPLLPQLLPSEVHTPLRGIALPLLLQLLPSEVHTPLRGFALPLLL
ncbi:hypothetical protein Taro_030332 [Colocasia esculenta]|uniref:Uncharacterized protein n=1 Tax=Colocasia esculenta TaxID=4460 RepID=A0A843VRN0_COLES|nr:hypothetical protein [Colocasia esculenta]